MGLFLRIKPNKNRTLARCDWKISEGHCVGSDFDKPRVVVGETGASKDDDGLFDEAEPRQGLRKSSLDTHCCDLAVLTIEMNRLDRTADRDAVYTEDRQRNSGLEAPRWIFCIYRCQTVA